MTNVLKNNFTHIHLHTNYSFLDGYGSCKSRAKKAKELGMTSLAITDHNHLGGCCDFKEACEAEGIKPLYGVELYYTVDTDILSLPAEARNELAFANAVMAGVEIPAKAKKKEIKELIEPYAYDTKQHHVLFIAKNQTGWSNLVGLQSEASKKCTYNGRFICDDTMIEKYKEGLIMTSACLGGYINQCIIKGRYDEATDKIKKYKEMFGDDFYLEIQPLNDKEQAICNNFLIGAARDLKVKLVATNDVHYSNKEDWDDHDTLLCIGIGKNKSDEERMRYAHEFWMRSYDEMVEAFNNQYDDNSCFINLTKEAYIECVTEAINNTSEISNKVCDNIKLGSDTTILPKLNIPHGMTAEQYLTLTTYKGLFKYISEHPEVDRQEYLDRAAFELNVINTKGYADYMLIIKDIVDWCESMDIPTGPGRGSAAGSLCLFVNRITKCVDPIKYGLLFSRFLTMDRTALPDIDTDFSYLNRQRVIQYLRDKYGEECVSFIGTYTEMGVKNGLKDVGRVLQYDFATMNNLSKKIDEWTDEAPSIAFKDLDNLCEGNEKDKNSYAEFKEYEAKYPELFRLARAFEGTPRNQGVHASGILVTPMPINDIFPTRIDGDGNQVTLYTGPQCEALGSCKLDILGLKTLDVLDLTVKAVDEKASVYQLYDFVNENLHDEAMFASLNKKETEGIFQLESNLFKGLIEGIKPESLEDITLTTAIGRPGPLSAGLHTDFADRKAGVKEAKEPLPNTWDIVKDSLGVLVYQEHAMRIAQKVAGFDDNQADSFLRKAMAKKKRALLDLCNQWFIYGKINEEPPAGYDYSNQEQPYYDPKGKYGAPILGGTNNGYTAKELRDYTIMIDDFCSYLFNKSHACAYSFITLCTMYLKEHYRPQFMAALLSMQDKQEKIDLYCKVAKGYGIQMSAPDINLSGRNFKAVDNKILYGIGAIKGVGEAAIPALLENRPYADLADAREKVGKKCFNKKVGEALIKAGAFDFQDKNRNAMLNAFQKIREAKKEEPYNENFTELDCMEYEKAVLGSSITYTPFWDTIPVNKSQEVQLDIIKTSTRSDRNGRLMAFIEARVGNTDVKGVAFASIYGKNVSAFDPIFTNKMIANIKKDEKGGFQITKIKKTWKEQEAKEIA